ncbi:MAG: DUF1847 domain-containing protein [Saccharofermentanales bacterium]|jgi:uncharacterized metal-binding protein
MDCVDCQAMLCRQGQRDGFPGCPMMEDRELYDEALEILKQDDNLAFFQASSRNEARGYGVHPRVVEVIAFCRDMGYKKIGLAYCTGLRNEAAIFQGLLEKAGFETVSAMCKSGGIEKEALGLTDADKVRPHTVEVICNPVAQALRLNREKTDFNVVIGLCVGHDSLFYKYSEAPVTTLIAKDRRLGHNPAAALYLADSGYMKAAFDAVMPNDDGDERCD